MPDARRMTEVFNPHIGDVVCDCRFRHMRVSQRDGDDLTLEDGFKCSLLHCCDEPGHTWEHPLNSSGIEGPCCLQD